MTRLNAPPQYKPLSIFTNNVSVGPKSVKKPSSESLKQKKGVLNKLIYTISDVLKSLRIPIIGSLATSAFCILLVQIDGAPAWIEQNVDVDLVLNFIANTLSFYISMSTLYNLDTNYSMMNSFGGVCGACEHMAFILASAAPKFESCSFKLNKAKSNLKDVPQLCIKKLKGTDPETGSGYKDKLIDVYKSTRELTTDAWHMQALLEQVEIVSSSMGSIELKQDYKKPKSFDAFFYALLIVYFFFLSIKSVIITSDGGAFETEFVVNATEESLSSEKAFAPANLNYNFVWISALGAVSTLSLYFLSEAYTNPFSNRAFNDSQRNIPHQMIETTLLTIEAIVKGCTSTSETRA